MRILQVHFKNLNSLAGEWRIDLTHPAFAADGIFAITGPTGAGKSTILDAICLALYGRTPRLNKVTKSGNEIMSRQTGECFAEVTFETNAGRYRCHWSQHRARKKPDGELQPPRHEIANADSGEIFESKIKGVADQIALVTGMDFDRFIRSMLLAQGGFDTFLKADADQRAPILEQITGTEIYSQISIRVHERQREEREKLNLLQAETAGILILAPDQEAAIAQLLGTQQRQETELQAQVADTAQAISWLNTIDGLKKEILSLAEQAGELHVAMASFKPEREQLNQALTAASLDGDYATLTAIRKQHTDDQQALRVAADALPGLETATKDQAMVVQASEQQSALARQALKETTPTMQKVRLLDQKIADQKQAVAAMQAAYDKDRAKIDTAKQARLEQQQTRSKADETLLLVDGYLKAHVQDEWLISGLAGLEEQLNGLLAKQDDIVRRAKDHGKASRAVQQAARSLAKRQKESRLLRLELEQASTQIQRGKDALAQLLGERLLREYRERKDSLLRELAYRARIAELSDQRTKLEDGTPCPLCGATEHPFAAGNIPAPDIIEQEIDALTQLIRQAEDHEEAIQRLSNTEAQTRNKLTEAEKLEFSATTDKQAAETALTELDAGLAILRAEHAERRQIVAAKLQPLGISDIPETDIASLIESLNQRLRAWQEHAKKKLELEKRIADINGEIGRLDAVIETQGNALAEKHEQLKTLNNQLAIQANERTSVYGEKHPDAEERRLNSAMAAAEVAEKQAREHHSGLLQQWTSAKAHVESLEKRIAKREPELHDLDIAFSAARLNLGFANEAQFLAARLPAERKSELAAKARELDHRHTELHARQHDRETRLTNELATKVTDKPLTELGPLFQQQENALKELRESIAACKHKLSENTAAKAKVKQQQAAIERQKTECRRWENLHDLIGSSDGKKYRNFAQGLTFDMMIGHANRQLRKMTDRYLLTRDSAQPLELNVIDNDQAGEIRSTKNLSGGESFIVSLSLALGLSRMASQNVRVDSLFLDEGFGTLDEDALDTALATLSGLQQDGKLIGVISHVCALKERISTQIQVIPRTGGRSRIAGPGCATIGTT